MIARFMGAKHVAGRLWDFGKNPPRPNDSQWNYTDMLYHRYWDWLIPVLDKIRSLGFDYAICSIAIDGEELSEIMISPRVKDDNIEIHTRTEEKLIDATYNAVLQFIQWHNINQK